MSFETKSVIWKLIANNIKKSFNIDKFKLVVFADGSGAVTALSPGYQELSQVFVFDNVEQIFTKFLVLDK
jgi:hypothetical protein